MDITIIAFILAWSTVTWLLFRDRKYNEKDLVSFGNYLLSCERYDRKKKDGNMEIWRERLSEVSDTDIERWMIKEYDSKNHITE